MKLPIGIMQGRLTPSTDGRLQFFPQDNWENEFSLAAEIGFDCLEWVFESNGWPVNPLLSSTGSIRIAELSMEHGVRVSSVCADYFMDFPFNHPDVSVRQHSAALLRDLMVQSHKVGVKTILIPVLEKAEVKSRADQEDIKSVLGPLVSLAEELGIVLGLECSLPAAASAEWASSFKTPQIKIYYDVGNATSYGFNAAREIQELSGFLGGVHIKDRNLNGPSVPLGQGGVDFNGVFRSLKNIGYNRPIILQAARDPEDRVQENARKNLNFVRGFFGTLN